MISPPAYLCRFALLALTFLAAACGPVAVLSSLQSGGSSDNPKATLPTPQDTTTGISFLASEIALRWTPPSLANAQRISFADSEAQLGQSGILVSSPLTATASEFTLLDLDGNAGYLVPNTTYYWRIDATIDDKETIGDIWSFTTAALTRQESEPINDILSGADVLYPGWTRTGLAGSSPGFSGEDWYRFTMKRGFAYAVEVSAFGWKQFDWLGSAATPEVSIIRLAESATATQTVLFQHRWQAERFGDTGALLYRRAMDLDFPLIAAEVSDTYYLRVRSASAINGTVPVTGGGGYAVRLSVLDGGMEYEADKELANDNNDPLLPFNGFTNDSATAADPVKLVAGSNAYTQHARIYAFQVVEDNGQGLLKGGFDYFSLLLPINQHVFECEARIVATRSGYRPKANGGFEFIDLFMNLWTKNTAQSYSTKTEDSASLAPNDPVVTLMRRPTTLELDAETQLSSRHDGHDTQGSFTDRDSNYAFDGAYYFLDVEVIDHTQRGLQTENPPLGPSSNDLPTGATALNLDQVFLGNINGQSADNVDWLSFSGRQGDLVSIQLWDARNSIDFLGNKESGDGSAVAVEPRIDIYLASNTSTPINSVNNTSDFGGLNPRLYLQSILPSTSTYYVRVQDTTVSGLTPLASGYEYLLKTSILFSPTFESELPSNNSIANADAFPLGPKAQVAGVLSSGSNDIDFYAFEAQAGEVIRFAAYASITPNDANILDPERQGWSGTAVPFLEVYSPSGQLVTRATNNPIGAFPFESTAQSLCRPEVTVNLGFLAESNGTHYLAVRDRSTGSASTQPTHRYVVALDIEPAAGP